VAFLPGAERKWRRKDVVSDSGEIAAIDQGFDWVPPTLRCSTGPGPLREGKGGGCSLSKPPLSAHPCSTPKPPRPRLATWQNSRRSERNALLIFRLYAPSAAAPTHARRRTRFGCFG